MPLAAQVLLDLLTPMAESLRGGDSGTGARSDFLRAFIEADKLYFEVPASTLNIDFLLYQENARQQQVLRWQRRKNKLLLIEPEVTLAAEPMPGDAAAHAGQLSPILAVFPIETARADGAFVIDVTRLFTTEV